MSKVYIKVDNHNRVVACEGGYTIHNVTPLSDWILIDEGSGDRYNLCQTHYFGPLRNADGVCMYKYINGAVVLRTSDEIEEDIITPSPVSGPTLEERINDLEIALCEIVDAMS